MSEFRAVPGNAGPADYPRMLYHADGRTRVVADATEHDKLSGEWSQTPYPVHQNPLPTPSAMAGAFDPLMIMIRDALHQVLDERGLGRTAPQKED